jgi:hypothetical protein
MLTLVFEDGDLDRLEKTEIYLAELDLKGFVRIEMDLLKERSSSAFYTLAVDEDTIRSNFFRPEHKISHHVRISYVSAQIVCLTRSL